MKTKELVRGHQGDVQIKQIDILPENLKPIKDQVIVDGSIGSGSNIHVVTGDVKLFKDDEFTYMVVGTKKVRLQHIKIQRLSKLQLESTKELLRADHKSILLSKGIYMIGIHKRFNPYKKVFEQLID